MNLNEMVEKQRELDERIVQEKGLEGEDLLPKRILALQVELGELANEWRGFKMWSNDREPRIWGPNPKNVCEVCDGQGYTNPHLPFIERTFCGNCDGCGVHFNNLLLEEYVDCLHFILSIGIEIGANNYNYTSVNVIPDTTRAFNFLFEQASKLNKAKNDKAIYYLMLHSFIDFGLKNLDFTWSQVEQAYMEKNMTNHERQEAGY
ncbi:dUTP diphosphatase [Salibacterium halotolerans]|uniref:Dimeric dUTPase, all-alpha-NTP-PPase (MazG) superfamily n=1 Tax=Salibacterium halotolerans TaxID=1884432 RepID=A0A1I5MLH3_9BACI|nr:dUTP diphosphatase [Salibacterium halotolerans]SFP10373.1 Dimeric dUTPase, all-alpha-NTP-PPase (MazG) superfamily [Salibacterium halotolerans]